MLNFLAKRINYLCMWLKSERDEATLIESSTSVRLLGAEKIVAHADSKVYPLPLLKSLFLSSV